VTEIEPGLIHYRQIDGSTNTQPFDFAMLLPPFRGVGLEVFDQSGAEITDTVFAPSGFMRVDTNHEARPFEQWTAGMLTAAATRSGYGYSAIRRSTASTPPAR